MRTLLCVLALAVPSRVLAAADPCDQPRPRDLAPLMKAVQDDDAMASAFDTTAGACTTVSAACDAESAKCQQLLTTTLQRQVSLDDGMYLRDMLLPFQGQKYAITAAIPTATVSNDVSCSADAASLKAAGVRRRQLGQKRRDIMNEYPRWSQWAAQLSQKCRSDALIAKQQGDAAATAAANSAAAAAAAAALETKRQEDARRVNEAAQAKIDAERRAREEAVRAQEEQRRRQAETMVEREKREREEQQRRIDDAARAKQAAEEQAKREAVERENARIVGEREGRKQAAEKKALELEAAEATRRAAADKAVIEARAVDRSDERLKGSVAALLNAYWVHAGNGEGSLLLGGVISGRYGWWMVAPAHGMASGFELKANISLHGEAVGHQGVNLFSVLPEARYFIGHFGFGAAFEWRRIFGTFDSAIQAPNDFALGPVISFAALDSPVTRLVFTARWMPIFSWDPARFTGEVEFAYEWFYCSLQGGTLKVPADVTKTVGWFFGGGLGARLRF